MAITQHSNVEEANSSSQQTRASRMNWLWIILGVIGGIAGNMFVRDRDPKFGRRLLVGGAIANVVIVGALWGVILLASSTASLITTTPPTAASPAPTQAPVTSGNGGTAPGSSLNLPTESESDAPTTVVEYMDGPNGIFAKMFQTGNPDYLIHYFYTSEDSEYATLQSELNQGTRITQQKLTNLTIVSTSVGSITAKFDVQSDNDSVYQHVTTYEWSSARDEWGVSSVVATPVG